MKRSTLIKSTLGALVVVGASIYGYYHYLQTPAPTYMTATPAVRDLKQQVYATGTIAGKVEVDVGAQVSGQIKKIYVEKGDKVKAGDLLCEIDPEIQRNTLSKAEAAEQLIAAQIKSQEAELKMLKAEHVRQQHLLTRSATTEQSAQQAEANYIKGEASLEALQAQYKQASVDVATAHTNLGYTRITAPMDGTIYAIPVVEGQTVNANQSTPTILRMANLDTMTVEAEISEADVVKVHPNMDARFTIMGLPKRYFQAKLKSLRETS